ncbi:MAG: hypothetical protein V3T83_16425 [Acidobacteriota bacterium]
MKAILQSFGLFLLSCPFVWGQATISALERDFESIEQSQDVTCFRLATLEQVPVELNMQLEVGDELIGTGSTNLELECAGGSRLRFSGKFRLLLAPTAEGEDCAINLLAGNANVTSENPTGMTSGETTLGSAGTIYEFRVSRGAEGGINQECVVYEGRVDVNYGSGWRYRLSGGQRADLKRGRARRMRVQKEDIERVAALYARLDASKARFEGGRDPTKPARNVRRAAYSELVALYQKVLTRPKDSDARLRLAIRQLDYSINGEAFYHVRRAESSAVGKTQKAYIALAQATLYSKIGDRKKADQQFQRARRYDPKIFKAGELRLEQVDKQRLQQFMKKEIQKPPRRD